MEKSNEYKDIISPDFYEKCPKAVFAAIAISFYINHYECTNEEASEALLKEWWVLYKQGIIPQKPLFQEPF